MELFTSDSHLYDNGWMRFRTKLQTISAYSLFRRSECLPYAAYSHIRVDGLEFIINPLIKMMT